MNWVKVFKNGPSNICGRLSSTNFTLSILEYLDPTVVLSLLHCLKQFKTTNTIRFQFYQENHVQSNMKYTETFEKDSSVNYSVLYLSPCLDIYLHLVRSFL